MGVTWLPGHEPVDSPPPPPVRYWSDAMVAHLAEAAGAWGLDGESIRGGLASQLDPSPAPEDTAGLAVEHLMWSAAEQVLGWPGDCAQDRPSAADWKAAADLFDSAEGSPGLLELAVAALRVAGHSPARVTCLQWLAMRSPWTGRWVVDVQATVLETGWVRPC